MDSNASQLSDQLIRLQKVQQDNLEDCLQRITKCNKYREDLVSLQQRLITLADNINYDIMVPFGSVAFMPGKLVHTNEVLVLLGENIFAERSTKQAREIVERRIQKCDTHLEELKQEQTQLENWNSFTNTVSEESGLVNIIEEYDEEAEKKWKGNRKNCKKVPEVCESTSEKSFEEIMEKLDELEIEEECQRLNEEKRETNIIEEETKHLVKLQETKKITFDEESLKHSSMSQSQDNSTCCSINSPADIYLYCKSISESKPLKSILKNPKNNISKSDSLPKNKSTKDKSKMSKVKFEEEKVYVNEEDSMAIINIPTNLAVTDTVIERQPTQPKLPIPEIKPKRVSLFKASQNNS